MQQGFSMCNHNAWVSFPFAEQGFFLQDWNLEQNQFPGWHDPQVIHLLSCCTLYLDVVPAPEF